MFKINYVLKRNKSEYSHVYPDNEKDQNHNIFIFKGGNGLGKSTIMEIIALGLYGHNLKTLSPEIRNKLNRFMDEYTEEFKFELNINSYDEHIKIKSKLDNKDIKNLKV